MQQNNNLLVSSLTVALLICFLALVTIGGICLTLPLAEGQNQLANILPLLAIILVVIASAAIVFIAVVWMFGIKRTFSTYRNAQLVEARVQAHEELLQVEQWNDRRWNSQLQKIAAPDDYAAFPTYSPPRPTTTHRQTRTTSKTPHVQLSLVKAGQGAALDGSPPHR